MAPKNKQKARNSAEKIGCILFHAFLLCMFFSAECARGRFSRKPRPFRQHAVIVDNFQMRLLHTKFRLVFRGVNSAKCTSPLLPSTPCIVFPMHQASQNVIHFCFCLRTCAGMWVSDSGLKHFTIRPRKKKTPFLLPHGVHDCFKSFPNAPYSQSMSQNDNLFPQFLP